MNLKINDIEDEELKNLALKQLKRLNSTFYEYHITNNSPIKSCFMFNDTSQGVGFLWKVCRGKITSIKK